MRCANKTYYGEDAARGRREATHMEGKRSLLLSDVAADDVSADGV